MCVKACDWLFSTPNASAGRLYCNLSFWRKKIFLLAIDIVEEPGTDVFGQQPVKKQQECVCPNCSRTLAANRFAPHLEKCMGMGRNSSRIASKRWGHLTSHNDQKWCCGWNVNVQIFILLTLFGTCFFLRLYKTLFNPSTLRNYFSYKLQTWTYLRGTFWSK